MSDDLEHGNTPRRRERTREQIAHSAAELLPVIEVATCRLFEIEVSEFPNLRDMIKAQLRQKKLREERRNEGIKEIVKFAVTAMGGAVMAWAGFHWSGKS